MLYGPTSIEEVYRGIFSSMDRGLETFGMLDVGVFYLQLLRDVYFCTDRRNEMEAQELKGCRLRR